MFANKYTVAAVSLVLVAGVAPWAAGHCQIPCGIYDDAMRFTMFEEHITTIEKSMNQINELSADPSGNANQLIRWVMNKEQHADYFAEIVTQYFLQQRIKPLAAGAGEAEAHEYAHKVRLCHEMLVATMKAKQTTDLQYVEQLRQLVADFKKAYFSEEDLKHMEEHGHNH